MRADIKNSTTARLSKNYLGILQFLSKNTGKSTQELLDFAVFKAYLPSDKTKLFVVNDLLSFDEDTNESIKSAIITIFENACNLNSDIICKTIELCKELEIEKRTILSNQREIFHMHEQVKYLLDLLNNVSDEEKASYCKLPHIPIDSESIRLIKDIEEGTRNDTKHREDINSGPYIYLMIQLILQLWKDGMCKTTFTQYNRLFRLLGDVVRLSKWNLNEDVKFRIYKILTA